MMEMCFDSPSKSFSNECSKLMLNNNVDNKNMFANLKSFMIDVCKFIRS